MKITKICPKCNSSDVVVVPDSSGYNTISIDLNFLHSGKVCRYVCCTCGYMESYVQRETDLAEIREKYGKR